MASGEFYGQLEKEATMGGVLAVENEDNMAKPSGRTRYVRMLQSAAGTLYSVEVAMLEQG